ncbi:recombinase family protein [Pantoea sp. Mhis]|uniref:recombinase family protein n=1 Tax=Pantoea sp. Mhis TaxID=2576759 RepID=UPI00135B944A|nr:recombinase family protein [Pantoea sp. Mhis]MXP56777.1 recombinase family protein [Pantoea sp. Mhis]
MTLYGYARVSTNEQNLTLQIKALRIAGCEIIRTEKVTGSSRNKQIELNLLMEFLRTGDTLVVTRIDRLARSVKDLQDIFYNLNQRKVTLMVIEQPIDTRTATGKAFLDILSVFSEFENNLRRERQMDGIIAAKARGVYRGRKSSIDYHEVYRLRAKDKIGATDISRKLGIARSSVYRILNKNKHSL